MGLIKQTKLLFDFAKNVKQAKGGESLQSERARKYIQDLVQDQGGLYLKVLQYMGTEDENLGKVAFEQITGIGKEEVERIVKSDFPQFSGEIQDESYAASIGQVNRGHLDGKDVAIKIRYPGIKELLEDQLRVIKLLPSLQKVSPTKKWGFDFKPYQESIQKVLDQECNLSIEAQELERWDGYLAGLEGVRVPKVYNEYTRENIYIQEFIEGRTVSEVAKDCQPRTKRQLAEKLVYSFLLLVLKHGKMQGDSNFGNYLFRPDQNEVIYLDLGQALSFSPEFIRTFTNAIAMRLEGEHFDTLSFFRGLGFDIKKLEPIEKKLDLLITVLLEPILSNRPVNLRDWSYKKDIDTLLGEDKWWFRSAGGTEFFLFMKGFLGLKNLLNFWNVNLNWHQLFKELVSREGLETEKIQVFEGRSKNSREFHGTNIEVRVVDGGDEKVKITMPFMAIFDLEDYIDDEVKLQIKAEGYQIDEMIKNALEDGGQPKEILNIKKGHKNYFVAII